MILAAVFTRTGLIEFFLSTIPEPFFEFLDECSGGEAS